MILLLVIIILFIITSGFLFNGKGAFLIAGYNTMSADEKSHYNERALCRATGMIGMMMLGLAISMALYIPGIVTNQGGWFIAGTVMMIACIVISLIYMNSSKKINRSA